MAVHLSIMILIVQVKKVREFMLVSSVIARISQHLLFTSTRRQSTVKRCIILTYLGVDVVADLVFILRVERAIHFKGICRCIQIPLMSNFSKIQAELVVQPIRSIASKTA